MSNENLHELVIDLKQKVIELCRLCNYPLPYWSLEQADRALATTEPVMANGLTEAETDATASVMGLATTEPEPTGMPELPEADVSFEDGKDQYGYPAYDHAFSLERIKTYGEQCWKAGYKRGAWAQVGDINVVESFTNDTKDAERYRWLADSNNYYEAINLISDGALTEDALGKAIDAAMAQGVK